MINRYNLQLYKLQIFMAVVQAGSFSAAAEQNHMTQSAVSQHIAELESILGATLFLRGRRGVSLTPAGETLLDYAQQIMTLVAEAEAAVTDVANLPSGQIRIGATPVIAAYVLPDWIGAFRDAHPHLTVALQTDVTPQVTQGVLSHDCAIGVIEGELNETVDDALGMLPLQAIHLYVVVGRKHPWWERQSIDADALHSQPFITRQQNSQTRIWTDAMLDTAGIARQIVAEFDHPESIKRAVAAGMGIAVLPDYALRDELERETLHALTIDDLRLQRELKLVWDRSVPFNPITRTFLEMLSDTYPQLSEIL